MNDYICLFQHTSWSQFTDAQIEMVLTYLMNMPRHRRKLFLQQWEPFDGVCAKNFQDLMSEIRRFS